MAKTKKEKKRRIPKSRQDKIDMRKLTYFSKKAEKEVDELDKIKILNTLKNYNNKTFYVKENENQVMLKNDYACLLWRDSERDVILFISFNFTTPKILKNYRLDADEPDREDALELFENFKYTLS